MGEGKRHRRYGIPVLLLVMVVGVVLVYAIYDRAQTSEARADRVDQITEVVCNNYDTLYRLIADSPPAPTALYRRLGFTEEQIADIAQAASVAKRYQLTTLGMRPEECPPR